MYQETLFEDVVGNLKVKTMIVPDEFASCPINTYEHEVDCGAGTVIRYEELPPSRSESIIERYKNMPNAFAIERYAHSSVRYALLGESSSVDRQWDVAGPVGLWIPSKDQQNIYNKIVVNEGFTQANSWIVDTARYELDLYSSWVNGDVWGVVYQVYNANTFETIDEDSLWNCVGYENAREEAKRNHQYVLERVTNMVQLEKVGE